MYKPKELEVWDYESYLDDEIQHFRAWIVGNSGARWSVIFMHDGDAIQHHREKPFSDVDVIICCSGSVVRAITGDERICTHWGSHSVTFRTIDKHTINVFGHEDTDDNQEHFSYLQLVGAGLA